jgi:tRNA nucleotidyltransferase (CCA-adding enzyme)
VLPFAASFDRLLEGGVDTMKITHDDVEAFAGRVVNLPRATVNEEREQVNRLRARLTAHIAKHPDFSLVKMLHGGSVAKGTALRNILDHDVAVYVRLADAPRAGAELVDWLADRLRDAYGGWIDSSQIEATTHCVNIHFKSSGIDIDVVPVLYKGDPDDRGYLISKIDGTPLLTSVRLHLDFVHARKRACPTDWAQVVRLVKWWVHQQGADFRFKSFMVELLCAHLLDTGKIVFDDYVAALDGFFDWILRTELSERVAFSDYYKASALPRRADVIEIFDPVNPENNVARLYTEKDQQRIVEAAARASDAITEARHATTRAQAIECWKIVLGDRFRG